MRRRCASWIGSPWTVITGTIALAGCGGDTVPVGPGFALGSGVVNGLVLELELEPDEIEPLETFTVTFRAHNQSDREISVTTPHSCLVLPRVYRGEARVPFRGTGLGCLTVITTHTFAPGEIVTRSWDLTAEYYATMDAHAGPAPPGTYRIRVEPQSWDDSWPPVELPLVVR